MWEYTSITAGDLESLIKQANILGEQGWEVVSFTSTKQGYGWGKHILILKRRK